MKYPNFLSSRTKKLITITVAFLLYGYSCRILGIYWFWESKSIGWTLFWIMIICILGDSIKRIKVQKRNRLPEKIGIGTSIFILVLKGIIFFVTPQTSAYESALKFLKTNVEIQSKVGTVKSVFVIPFGGMSMQGSVGEADLYFTVKGDKKFTDVNLHMFKDSATDWQIEIAR